MYIYIYIERERETHPSGFLLQTSGHGPCEQLRRGESHEKGQLAYSEKHPTGEPWVYPRITKQTETYTDIYIQWPIFPDPQN